jgi:hypothetical protein
VQLAARAGKATKGLPFHISVVNATSGVAEVDRAALESRPLSAAPIHLSAEASQRNSEGPADEGFWRKEYLAGDHNTMQNGAGQTASLRCLRRPSTRSQILKAEPARTDRKNSGPDPPVHRIGSRSSRLGTPFDPPYLRELWPLGIDPGKPLPLFMRRRPVQPLRLLL